MKIFTSDTQKFGELGEDLACKYLIDRGYSIIERNFTRKCGEIDIIAKKQKVTHFIEVKSVSRESFSYVLPQMDDFRPEDQMHTWKQERLMKVISVYLEVHRVGNWQFDVACVYIDRLARKAEVKVLEDIILGEN